MVTVMFDLLVTSINLFGWGYNAFIKTQEGTARRCEHASRYPRPWPALQPQPKLETAVLQKSGTASVEPGVCPAVGLCASRVSGLSASATALLQCLSYGSS